MRLITAVFLTLSAAGQVIAQGLVNFNNNSSTPIYAPTDVYSSTGYTYLPMSGPAGSYYFGLLIAPTNVTSGSQFTFTGIYATNTGAIGLFGGGSNVTIPGWAPGTAANYYIAGWSAAMGHDWNPAWLYLSGGLPAFGVSALGSGVAGGSNGSTTFPTLDLFGGTAGLKQGFVLYGPALVPEPSSFALLIFAAATLLISRRRQTPLLRQLRIECPPSSFSTFVPVSASERVPIPTNRKIVNRNCLTTYLPRSDGLPARRRAG